MGEPGGAVKRPTGQPWWGLAGAIERKDCGVLNFVNSATTVTLDVWADLACPWCYIGSRRLALALAHEPDGSVVTRWRAFQLQPNLAADGVPAGPYFRNLFGSDEAARAQHARVSEAGRDVGITFDFKRQTRIANTSLAQQAVLLYDGEIRQRAVAASLYGAYFERGLDITDLCVVAAEAARAADDDPERVKARVTAGESVDRLEADFIEARMAGVSAVPTYVAAGRVALQGAQEVATLRTFIARARALAAAG